MARSATVSRTKAAWVFTAPGAGGRGSAALGAAPTAMPGVVFQGAGDGGAINTAGAVVVDGMVYVVSGYAISSGASAGNVLLAFGVN